MPQLLEMLAHKRELLTQILLVASILGAFSVSGLVALMVGEARAKLHRFLFLSLCIAALAFIFAMTIAAILLPVMSMTLKTPGPVWTLLYLSQFVDLSMLIGYMALFAAVGGMGFTYSRRIGYIVLAATIFTFCVFIGIGWYVMRAF